jgi:hypothetical protein
MKGIIFLKPGGNVTLKNNNDYNFPTGKQRA